MNSKRKDTKPNRKLRDRRVNGLMRDYRELEDSVLERNRTREMTAFETEIGKNDVDGAWYYLQDLGELFCESRGAKLLLEGNHTAGWRDIEQSTYYGAMYLGTLPRDLKRDRGPERTGHVLAHSVLLEWWDIAERMAQILIDNLECDGLVWRDGFFHFFVLAIWQRLRSDSQALDLIGRIGVYQKILDAWTDDERLAEALLEAIEYHLQNTTMFEDSDEAFTGVWELAPLEIELVRKVRSAEGLSMPTIEHPLLETPFAKIPGAPSRYRPGDDPLVQQALALTRELRPELGL